MKRSIVNGHEILSDGSRVWINGPDGASVARFSSTAGRDVHKPFAEQGGSSGPCLDCAPDTDFSGFAASVLKHYGLAIPAKHRPGRHPRVRA